MAIVPFAAAAAGAGYGRGQHQPREEQRDDRNGVKACKPIHTYI